MALDREREIVGAHAGAVIGDADQPQAAARGRDVDPARAGIDRVLDQLLDDARRPLDDLTRGDAVDEVRRQLTDGHLMPQALAGEIPAGQHFTQFYRRLVERVDAQKMRREDGFQHEMHHQRARAPLVEDIEIDGAHRAPLGHQRLGDGALLRRDQVAGGMAGEIIGAGELGEVGRHARAAAGAILADHGDEVLRRAVEIELELAVLVDRAKRRDRRGALAVLAEALAPELHIPGGEARQAVGIRKHHGGADAALLGEADGDGGAERGSEVPCPLRFEHRLRPPSGRRRATPRHRGRGRAPAEARHW